MKKELKDGHGRRIHPYVPELCEQLRKEEIDRREFLRTATLLGVSVGAAYALAGKITGQEAVVPKAAAQTPKKGGTLRYAMRVQEMSDPALPGGELGSFERPEDLDLQAAPGHQVVERRRLWCGRCSF